MEEQEIFNEIETAVQLGAALSEASYIEGVPYVAIPDDFHLENLTFMLQRPPRKRGNVMLRDVKSFIDFVKQESGSETRIYGRYNPPLFMAVFNDHAKDGANWRDHLAEFNCPISEEWKIWLGSSGKQLAQSDFSRFIEDNLPDIAHPPAADMLEISRTLEAKKKVSFSSGIRLSNGENELTYEEQISGTASKGKITVPETFTIGIPVLENGTPYAVECRLRYRIGDGGKMAMWYELIRPQKILEDAVKEVWTAIETNTGIQVLNGSI